MRRTSAPSFKHNKIKFIDDQQNHCNDYKNIHRNNEQPIQVNLSREDKLGFNVVFGKMSTKKHKTYQDEGKLIISGTSLKLTDLNGKIIGTTIIKKSEILEEGSRICIGGKDVELIEKICILGINSEKRPLQEEPTNTKPIKMIKQTKFCSPIIKSTKTNNFKHTIPSIENETKTRTFSNVLNLLLDSSSNNESKQKHTQTKENTENLCPSNLDDTTYYNVVYGKISTKKHKTYQEDGQLVILGNSLTLKNLKGKIIDSTVIEKKVILTEGSQVCIGSMDVELIQKISNFNDDNTNCISETQMQAIKQTQFFKPTIDEKVSLEKNIEPLKMPHPNIEHQRKYNQLLKPISDVYVTNILTNFLRPHQREGVIFLYECLMGFRLINHFGAILADEMGLGKTLQCITICYTLLKQGPYGTNIGKRILIVTSSSLVQNWDAEISKWLKNDKILTFVVDAKHKPEQFASATRIPFMIISYEMFAMHFEMIKSIKFDIIVCDEGHRLKNCNIKVAVLLNEIDCPRRIILTGTPIQNDLHEFYSLINFVNPGIFGTYNEYKKYYETPIVQSQQPNADTIDKELGEQRVTELNKIIKAFVLRRTQDVINQYLPKKTRVHNIL